MFAERQELISDLGLASFFDGRSLFRRYQDLFLARFGPELEGEIIEIGGQLSYQHQRFFPRATNYRCTNVARDHEEYLDVTQMTLPDASVNAMVCVSVLEHVFELQRAAGEISRVMRPGGKLLLAVPFAYPRHDEVDFWRLAPDAFLRLFPGFRIQVLVHLGGMFSSIADNLKRPKGRYGGRYFFYKMLGAMTAATFGRLDQMDGFPLGYGVVAERLP